jgi:hypothetical protein
MITDPLRALDALRRIECSTVDGAPAVFWFDGKMYGRRAGEGDRLLFNLEGMLVRASVGVSDAVRGRGFKRVGREMMLYRDPATNAVLETWTNPWSGETVPVVQVANDHVNGLYYEKRADGSPFSVAVRTIGSQWQMPQVLPIYRENPLGAGYEAEIGGMYHAVELFAFSGDAADLTDPSVTSARVAVSWSRVSDWLPWMKMRGREGQIYAHVTGMKLNSWDDMPTAFKAILQRDYPAFQVPPPLDDNAVMDTSWTEYRRIVETGEKWFANAQ